MKEFDLWESVGNGCLKKADSLLEKETIPTATTVEMVSNLVSIAIAIDSLNLRWTEQTRSCAAAFRGLASEQREAKN